MFRRAVPALVDHLEQIATTGDLIACLSDADGRVIWQSTPLWLRRGAERIGLTPGGLWHEAAMGTNGLGLSLAADRPSAVFASEHWMDHVHDWVCYAAPIHGPDATQVGAVNLSTTWKNANPLALTTVASLAKLVEHELRSNPAAGLRTRVLDLRVLGEPVATFDGTRLRLTQRQYEILAILAVRGRRHPRRAARAALRRPAGRPRHPEGRDLPPAPGARRAPRVASVPPRPAGPGRRRRAARAARAGRRRGRRPAVRGQLLPASESPFVVDLRHELDVALRTALLRDGTSTSVLRYTSIHPYDADVLERVGALVPLDDPLYPAVTARLAVARAG